MTTECADVSYLRRHIEPLNQLKASDYSFSDYKITSYATITDDDQLMPYGFTKDTVYSILSGVDLS